MPSLQSLVACDAANQRWHAAPAMQSQWTCTQRVMGEVLLRDEKPRDIWDQHEALLCAVTEGNADAAERLARQHVLRAATFLIARLRSQRKPAGSASTADGSASKTRATKGNTAKTGADRSGARSLR
ncbi:FCD domain-containing protein [Azohydromonas lata]|uniref:FCD domain-containing protein n=1 Tax=Azohydromonas lata TaxID=45677 RepID=UPI00082D0ED5|nr:FCD domain-containing protein [Azohydromonas lata]